MTQFWKIAPGEGAENWDLFRNNDCIGIGWLPDVSYLDFGTESEVLQGLEAEHGKNKPGAGSGSAKTIWKFVHEVKTGDVVVANKGSHVAVGIGIVTSDYIPPKSRNNPIKSDETTHRHHVRCVDWLVTEAVELPERQSFAQQTLCSLSSDSLDGISDAYRVGNPELTETVEQLIRKGGYPTALAGSLPDEVPNASTHTEGALKQVTVNAYERNWKARRECIEHYGATCCVCGFDFGARFGPEADGYIHVHHLRPLSEIGHEYKVDPITDLRPVCPNCHTVIHLGGGCRSIEEVKRLLSSQA